jgi:chromosome segregation ATPase
MKRVLVLSLAALVALAGVVVTTTPAAAVSNARQQQPLSEERCIALEKLLATKADNLENATATRALQFQHLHIMVNTHISKLKQAGYDTTKLETDLTTLKGQLTGYNKEVDTLQASLDAVREQACAANRADYTKALQTVRQDLKDVREAAKQVRTTYTATIIPDIKDAASWLRKN